MFAFLVNTIAVIIGSIIGLIFRKSIKKEICDNVLKTLGIVVFIVGLLGVLENMLVIDDGKVSSTGALILIISITVGTFIGELIRIDHHLNVFSEKIENTLNKGKISEGFITASLIYCIGSMGIIGTMEATLGNSSTIYLKSVIDGITSIALASTLGFGVILSSITVFLYQGLLTLLFWLLGDFMSAECITLFSMVGYTMVCGLGLNFIIKDKIKVANMLPSLIVVIIYYLFMIIL